MYTLYTLDFLFVLTTLLFLLLFILSKTKRPKLVIRPRHYLYMLISLFILTYIYSSLEKYVLLIKYKKFSEHMIEFISESESSKLKYPENICDLNETNSFQTKKKYILSPFNPKFGFSSEVVGDTLKFVLYTNIYGSENKKVNLEYKYAFYPFFYEDIVLIDSWVRPISENEVLKELEKIDK